MQSSFNGKQGQGGSRVGCIPPSVGRFGGTDGDQSFRIISCTHKPYSFSTSGIQGTGVIPQHSQELCPSTVFNIRDTPKVLNELRNHLPHPYVPVQDEWGIHVLLLSRDQEKSVQRRVSFSFSGEEQITVHRKPVCQSVLQDILQCYSGMYEQVWEAFVQRIVTVVKRLRSYEVCVGVNNAEFKPLWEDDHCGEIDKNPYGELRYSVTFRPFDCHLLVPTDRHLKRRCSVCIQTIIRFRGKVRRHMHVTNRATTPNVHLDRAQLIHKLDQQQRKLKHSRAHILQLKKRLNHAISQSGINLDEYLTDELISICMAHTAVS